MLPAGRILAGMTQFQASILIFTSCQMIYIPCLYDLIAFAGMAHWSISISFSAASQAGGQIGQLVGIFLNYVINSLAGNVCIEQV